MSSTNTSNNGSGQRRATLPQHPSELTISDLTDNNNNNSNNNDENTPLLNNKASNNNNKKPNIDRTALYVKVIEEHLPWYKRPSVFWLLPIFGMAWITSGMLASSQGQFQAALLCREYLNRHTSNFTSTALLSAIAEGGSNGSGVGSFLASAPVSMMMASFQPSEECKVHEIQAFTAKILALLDVITGLASASTIGYYTSLSDKYGRKVVMILGFFNSLLVLGSFVLMSSYWDQIGLPLMILSGLLNGLLGGTTLGVTMALAYAADCTDPAKRSLAFSWLHAGLYFGLAIGPITGGLISEATGTILAVAYIDIAATSLSLFLTVFFLPESLPSRQPEHLRRLYTVDDTKDRSAATDAPTRRAASWHSHTLQALSFFKPNGRNTNLVLLAAISFLQMLAYRGTLTVIILYTNQIFNWSYKEDGIMFSLSSTARLVTLLIFLPLLVHFYQKSVTKKQRRLAAQATSSSAPGLTHGRGMSYGTQDSSSLEQEQEDTFNRNQRSPTLHDEAMGRSDVVSNQTVFNPHDPTIAASLQALGERTLELGDFNDDDGDNVDDEDEYDEESFLDKRRRQSSADSLVTLIPSKATANRSPRLNRDQTSSTSTTDELSTSDTATSTTAGTVRSKEQAFSDMKFDTWMIRLGFAINSITYVGYGLARESWHFYLATALHAASIIASPSLKSLLTSVVEPSQFGAVLGALQVVDSIAAIFSPILISGVYAMTVSTMPEFVWYSCAFWTGICVLLAFMIRQKQFRSNMLNA
ncbi:hypothetical protein BGX24_010665 [Mortierella sp. AD032]|nr:hypothetical protein BGX24_010665 [Mortierella sp. AD032]